MQNEKDSLSLCEKTRLAALSSDELTEEMKRHLETCGECRAFLDKNEELSKELSALCVPGINSGDVAERVMKGIHAQKTSVFKRFHLANHLGTAAAAIIVIAIFAVNRGYNLIDIISGKDSSPSGGEYITSEVSDTSDGGILNGKNVKFEATGASQADYSDESAAESARESAEDTATAANQARTAQNFYGNAQSESAQSARSANLGVQNVQNNVSNAAQVQQSAPKAEIPNVASESGESQKAAQSAPSEDYFSPEKTASDEAPDVTARSAPYLCSYPQAQSGADQSNADVTISGAAFVDNGAFSDDTADGTIDADESAVSGSGGASMFSLNSLSNEAQENDQAEQKKAEFEENDGIGVYPEEAEETFVSIFDGVAFDSSENALEANIETANSFVTEIFSEAQQLNADVLTRSGFTNKDFLEWIKTVENVEQYSFESIYEYFNE